MSGLQTAPRRWSSSLYRRRKVMHAFKIALVLFITLLFISPLYISLVYSLKMPSEMGTSTTACPS